MKVWLDDLTLDPAIQLRARGLDPATVEDYAAALEHGAVFPPVVVFQEGGTLWLAGGFHRHAAHRAVGRAEIEAEVQPGTHQEAMIYAATDNATHGRSMSRWEKQEAGERLIRLTDWSDREIARRLTVGNKTVSRWRQALSVSNDTDSQAARTVTRSGTTYTMRTAGIGCGSDDLADRAVAVDDASPPPLLSTPEAGRRAYQAAVTVFRTELPSYAQARLAAETLAGLGEEASDEELLADLSRRVAAQRAEHRGIPASRDGHDPDQMLDEPAVADDRLAVHFSSVNAEWLTPPHIIVRVVRVLGGIDLDPCSNDGAPNVPAARHFTVADDGLAQEWTGRVYMNPVYGRTIGQWVEKLVREHAAGHVPQALALLPARTDTAWFRLLVDYPLCFLHGRLNFSGHENGAPFPSVVVGLGCDLDAFLGAFEDIGAVFRRVTK
ncbi:MAG: ParB N-terminal domain-containing protein [Chloroflexi bacterium]|nr:ParB N-terminal domain-containing protein [Chloroflexota bacterium]